MKNLFALFICLFTAIGLSAQSSTNSSEHLKFMGIPLTGTISQFHSKILAKGCKVSKYNNLTDNGTRAYTGSFIGNKADIYVYYDVNTKIVYRAKAVISGLSDKLADQKYIEFKYKLMQKYGDGVEGENNGKSAHYFISYDLAANLAIGEIDIYISENESYYGYPYHFNLHIDYWDYKNKAAHNESDLDEL